MFFLFSPLKRNLKLICFKLFVVSDVFNWLETTLFIKKKFSCCLIKLLKYKTLNPMLLVNLVHLVISLLWLDLVAFRESSLFFEKLKSNPNLLLLAKKRYYFLRESFVFQSPQPALSVQFLRLFILRTQSI